MESFTDTPVVNGTAYPVMEVQPKSYRFRILNAADDRTFNLQLYTAASQAEMWKTNGTLNDADAGEVKMVPAIPTQGYPATWPTDGRDGGAPDPATVGPSMIQIGNEAGFLPAPAVLPNQPINWNLDQTTFNFGNLTDHTLLLGPAERGDVIVDFSKYAGQTLILYNDCPAPVPALDPRYDYYTGNPDLTATGGAPSTQPGYGPNTRTIMRIKVAATKPSPAFNLTKLNAAFASTATTEGVFEASQDPIIYPSATYDSAYNKSFPADPYLRIYDTQATFNTVNTGTALTIPFEQKAIQDEMGEAYDTEYGRMSGFLGIEVAPAGAATQAFIQYPLASPPVDILVESVTQGQEPATGDGTQIWKIVHNGVDTHPLHFHKYDVQLINRVAWDNLVIPPDPNELGWKETVRVNPLEDTYVAMRPVVPTLPFDVPNSVRMIDPTKPVGDPLGAPPPTLKWFDPAGNMTAGPAGPGVLTNELVNFGWEYVLHCHILSHEEMDMMHAMPIAVKPPAPSDLVVTPGQLSWTDNSINETSFEIEWADNPAGPWTAMAPSPPGTGKGTTVLYPVPPLPPDPSIVTTRYYRVLARNSVGGDQVNFPFFPLVNADSAPVVWTPPVP
jgi:FtsP/CotA-like multicopper oxidase with cupredoxin domain